MDMSSYSDEKKALTAAMVTLVVVSVAGAIADLPFGVRSTLAITAAFGALLAASYYLTGSAFTFLSEDG